MAPRTKSTASKNSAGKSLEQMIINYVPGEECRVAVVEDGKLEELHAERFASASRVGNIYLGKVSNVEPNIQAAFVDFGLEENGFLHISDLHPRYFPGEDVEETTERVGFKTPRRERPPIQRCLKRGQEVVVQVLKEGVGTKGPTLTSYLSIPGRFLVMMPQMDRVGVSRKVEDEEARAKMRQILDQLELPEGFGFILRTAGMDRNKTELKRDLAYLQRLWKDMDRRLQTGSKPRLLYSESDLLVRCLRDVLTGETDEIIIDNEQALKRASRFLKIVAPRTTTRLLQYPGRTPIFHAFGIEQQIANIGAREVPLPSGGRLVIDQTEALVAIDVNSGKSRDARDAEENAYQTNVEAVDEICRQLRLRDLGGIVINDLIDMRHASHRKDIEQRMRERLKRDRARSTVTAISEFGILELTRQRMRGSHEQAHFHDCPTCRGRGLIQKPDSVASDALRDLAAVLDVDRIHRVELVVPARVAGELLSTKRQLLSRIERHSGKRVDVRVSETLAADRVTYYGYDASGADVDLTNLPKPKRPRELVEWKDPDAPKAAAAEGWSMSDEEMIAPAEPDPIDEQEEPEPHPIEFDGPELDADQTGSFQGSLGPARGRGGSGRGDSDAHGAGEGGDAGEGSGGRRRRRRGRRGRGGSGGGGMVGGESAGVGGAGPGRTLDGESRAVAAPREGSPPRNRPGRSQVPSAEGVDSPMNTNDNLDPSNEGRAENGERVHDSPADSGDRGFDPSAVGPDGEPRRGRRRRRRGRRGRGGGGGQTGVGSGDAIGGDGASREFADEDRAGGEPAEAGSDADLPNSGLSASADADASAESGQSQGARHMEDVEQRRGGYRNDRRDRRPAPSDDSSNGGSPKEPSPLSEDSDAIDSSDRDVAASDASQGDEGFDDQAEDRPHGGGDQSGVDGDGTGPRRRRRRRRRGRGNRGGDGVAPVGGVGSGGFNGEPVSASAPPQLQQRPPRNDAPPDRPRDARGGERGGERAGTRGGGRGEGRGGGDRGGRGGDRGDTARDGRTRGGRDGRDRGGQPPRGRTGPSDAPSSGSSKPSAPPPPATPPAPQPKLLYSFRRKLSPSELNRRPKPE